MPGARIRSRLPVIAVLVLTTLVLTTLVLTRLLMTTVARARSFLTRAQGS
jgi:hypothetical protein